MADHDGSFWLWLGWVIFDDFAAVIKAVSVKNNFGYKNRICSSKLRKLCETLDVRHLGKKLSTKSIVLHELLKFFPQSRESPQNRQGHLCHTLTVRRDGGVENWIGFLTYLLSTSPDLNLFELRKSDNLTIEEFEWNTFISTIEPLCKGFRLAFYLREVENDFFRGFLYNLVNVLCHCFLLAKMVDNLFSRIVASVHISSYCENASFIEEMMWNKF